MKSEILHTLTSGTSVQPRTASETPGQLTHFNLRSTSHAVMQKLLLNSKALSLVVILIFLSSLVHAGFVTSSGKTVNSFKANYVSWAAGTCPFAIETGSSFATPLLGPVLTITGNTDHGSSCVGSAAGTITYTITNTGTDAAGVAVVSDNSQFVVTGAPTDVPGGGGTATYEVTFTPGSSGPQSAIITVSSTSPGSNSPFSNLSGFGDGVSPLTVLQISEVKCFGGQEGSATVTAPGSTSAYTYLWNTVPPQTTVVASGLSAGTYTVTVSDGSTCAAGTAMITIAEPSELTAIAVQSNPVTCANDGIASVTASGGTPDYTYSWSTSPVQNTGIATGLSAGTYTVTVTDFNGCTTTAIATIIQLIGGPVTTIGSAEICDQLEFVIPLTVDNFSDVGAINLTLSYNQTYLQVIGVTNNLIPSDWAPDFNYGVSGKITIAAFGGTTAFSLPPASDLLYITFKALAPINSTLLTWNELPPNACEYGNENGEFVYCKNPFGDYFKNGSVKINPVISAGISAHSDVQCSGSSTGSATVTASGGNSVYSYYWNSSPPQYTNVASGLSAGIYAVQVTDAGSCAATATVEILQPGAPLLAGALPIKQVTCAGGNDGIATVTVSGGWNTNYSYLWNNGQSTPTATQLTAGIYIVTVTDAGSCAITASTTITNMRAGPVTTISTLNLCPGTTSVDVPVKVSSFNNVGGFQLHFSYVNGELTSPVLVPGSLHPDIDAWGTFLINTATAGTITLSAYGLLPNNGVTLADGTTLFSLRFSVVSGTTSSTINFDESPQGTYCEYTDVAPDFIPFCDKPFADYYKAGVVTLYPVLTASISATSDVSCFGGSNGSATVSASGGTSSYSYLWNTVPVQNTIKADGLTAGTYTVTVTDGSTCAAATAEVTITQPTLLVATAFQSKPVTCSADGIATVTASDGTPDYTYSWNTVPVQTTDMATGLTAGIYMVTVTDFNGCTMTATAAVEQLPGGPVTTIGSLEVCDQLEFTLPLTVDNFSEVGAINLTFSYNTAYLQVMGVTNNLIPADWAPDFNYSVSGKVTIAAFGGTTAFSLPDASDLVYVTFKALEPVTSTALTWNELPPTACEYGTQFGEFVYCRNPFGDYFKNGNVKINPVITAGITTHTDVQCFGSSSGSATVTVAGGNSAYSYYWNSTPPQYSNVASGLSAGIYAVQVSDAGSCAATATVEILQPSGPLSVSISQINPVTCAGGSNGSATVSAEGGWSSAYTYLWNDGQNTPTAALLTAGTYTVTVTDANSCVATASALINEMRAGPVTTITNVTVCSGATTVDVPVKVSSFNNVGGLQLHLTYDNTKLTVPTLVPGSLQPGIDAWGTWLMNTATPGTIVLSAYGLVPTDGVTLADGATLFSVRFDVVSGATSSTITFDENVQGTFCEYTDVAPGYTPFCDIPFVDYYKPGVVTIIPVLTANIINHTNIHCYGSNNGSATVSASGGTSSYSYLWNTVPAQITNVASGLTAGTYTVTVTDGSTCASATASVTLTQPQALSIVIAHTNLQCFGANNGTATVTVTGGTTPYSYDWNTSPVQHGNPATGLAAGSYTVTVTDANTCTITSTVEITGPAALSVPISHVDVTCFGGNDGSATVTVSGGSTPYSYLWNDAAAQTSYMATGLIAGTYVVTVTDVCSVNATATAVITQPAQVTVNAGPDQSLCQQTYAVIYGDPQPAGVWSQVSGANPVFFYYIPALNGYLVYGIQMADSVPYVFKFTVTVGSCSYSDTMKLYNFHYPSVPYAGTDKNVCLKSYPLNVVIMNGTHPLYGSGTWTPVAGTPPHTIDSIHNPHTRIWYTDPGTYKFLWTVTNGACNSPLNNDTCVITVYAPLDVNAGPDAVVCGGSPYYISGSSGTTDPCVTRLWKTSGTGTFNFTNILHPIYTPSPADILAGHVTLTIKDSIGCCSPCGPAIDEDFMVLTFSPPPVLTLSVTNVDCNGSNSGSITASVTSGGVPPYSYLWNNSQTAATATGLTAGTYSVTVTDANTCSAWASAVITEPSKLSIVSSVITNVNCYTYNTGIISLTADGGVTPYNYLWNNAQTTNVATGLTAGTYTVTVSDAHSCSLIQTWSVTQPEAWSIGINGPTSACCNLNAPYSNAVYTATVGGSYLAPVTYQWAVEGGTIISGQNTISITVNWSCCTNGKVWLTVTDSKPCVLTTFIPIVISPVPAPIITGPQEVTAGQANTQYCTPDYAGHLYSWTVIGGTVSSGQGTHCITVTWGAYPSCGCGSVSVSETFNGCTGTYTLPISIIPGLNVDIAGYMSYDNVYQTRLNGVALQLRNSSNAIVGNTVTINNPANGEPGYYAFTNVPNGTYSISGSYNGTWGGNNATDALLVQLFVLSSYPMNAFQQIVADVNASLTISGLDALYIKLRTVGSITSYPAGDWKIKDTTFTSPNTSLNLTALCFGDVNNSFIPMGYKETTFLSLIEDGVMRVPVSEPFTYDIHSSREAELGAMTLFLGYDQDRFEVIDITSNSEGLKYSFGNGKIAVAWSDTKPMKVNTNDLLLSLNMRTKDKITEPSRVFHIQPGSEFTDVLANPYDNFDLKMPNVVTPGGSQEISLYNYPNPFSGTTNIVYTLPESGHATLVLTDLYGHTIRTLVDQTENAGSYTVTVDPAGLNMTPGVYLYKIIFDSSTDTYVKVNKMVFTR